MLYSIHVVLKKPCDTLEAICQQFFMVKGIQTKLCGLQMIFRIISVNNFACNISHMKNSKSILNSKVNDILIVFFQGLLYCRLIY